MIRPSPGLIAQMACILEVSARKPGNVHPDRSFDDLACLDFLLSAAAIAGPFNQALENGVGATILAAVEATRSVVASNTNLGMILLLAPLAAVPPGADLKSGVRNVLDALTIDDAKLAYRAIRLAAPGGLGRVEAQDISAEPAVTLREAMRLAADRDQIARQYANGFTQVFELATPRLREAIYSELPLEPAIVRTHLEVLAIEPDTLILRKRGATIAAETSRHAAQALATGDLAPLNTWFQEDAKGRNPGSTADLVTAALFVALLEGTISLPRPPGAAGWVGS